MEKNAECVNVEIFDTGHFLQAHNEDMKTVKNSTQHV